MMFAIGIHFLNGWMMGKFPSSHDEPEWPPHPDRVFMALAAAHFETGGSEEEYKALQWLEKQKELPSIIASRCNYRDLVTSYVPVNDTEISRPRNDTPTHLQGRLSRIRESQTLSRLKEVGLEIMPESRSRQPRSFPVAIPDHPIIFMVWPDANVDDMIRNSLIELCRKVTYIGHSASLVQMWVEDSLPPLDNGESENGLRWLEPKQGQTTRYQLRITGSGRLKNLQDIYPELRPTSSLWSGYEVKMPKSAKTPEHSTCFSPHILILRRIHGKPMGLVSTLQLTKALRDTIIKACPEPVPEWVSGHQEDGTPSEKDHLAIVPLPFVGTEHADGHLLGLGLVIPELIEQSEITRCFKTLLFHDSGMPKSIELKLGRFGVWELEIEDREDNQRQLSLREWIWNDPARRWATVTPIAIDRHAKGQDKWQQVEENIKKACERIGLPSPTYVIPMPVSGFIGVPHGQLFPKITRKSDEGKIFHTHAVIEFPEPVCGPILLGAGRYRGYGFCRPYKEGGSNQE